MLQNGHVSEPTTSSDREFEHASLQRDIEIIRSYGDDHPDDWTDVLFENEPTVQLVALFAGDDVAAHERALRSLVEHRDKLVVRQTKYSGTQLEAFSAEVTALARSSGPGTFNSWGVGRGRLFIDVAADQERLAAILLAKYGDAAELKVGAFSYPMAVDASLIAETEKSDVRPTIPLTATLEGSFAGSVSVPSGGRWHGPLHMTNLGTEEVILRTNGGLTARIINPSTEEVVGGFVGAQAIPLRRFTIAPHRTMEIPLVIETASFKRHLGYVVPPGDWMIDAIVDIEGMGPRRIPPLPLVIEPRSH